MSEDELDQPSESNAVDPVRGRSSGWLGVSVDDDQLTATDWVLNMRSGAGPMRAELKAVQRTRRRFTLAALIAVGVLLAVVILIG